MKITATTIDEYILQYPPEVQALDGAYIEFPCDVKTEFGKGRMKVHATFDGEPYDGNLVRMQTPCHIIRITKATRKKIAK